MLHIPIHALYTRSYTALSLLFCLALIIASFSFSDASSDSSGHQAEFTHQLSELGWPEGLGTVAQGIGRIDMHLDYEPVSACGNGG